MGGTPSGLVSYACICPEKWWWWWPHKLGDLIVLFFTDYWWVALIILGVLIFCCYCCGCTDEDEEKEMPSNQPTLELQGVTSTYPVGPWTMHYGPPTTNC